MKKIFCIVLFLFFNIPLYCIGANSSNSFEIELKEVPPGNTSKPHSSLSNGEITAIALGSSFGGIGLLSAIGYYFFNHSKGLACGFACDEKCPYELIDIENCDFITKSKNTYLIKAYEYSSKDKNYKYLIIPDTQIKPNTYNTILFNFPSELIGANFKIIQSSTSFLTYNNIPEIDSDIFFNDKNAVKISASIVKSNSSKGILIKQGKITEKENILALTTIYKSSNLLDKPKSYAIIVVFEK